MTYFTVASLQLELTSGDNRASIESEIKKSKSLFPAIDMILLPELASFGPNPAFAEVLPSETVGRFQDLARELSIWIIPGSLFIREDDGRVFNTTPVINPRGELIASYRKIFPFYPYEKETCMGDEFVVFDVPDIGRFGVSICFDQWFPEVTRQLSWLGAEVILCPTLTPTIDRDLELALARANAAIGQVYFLNPNAAGDIGVGQSTFIDPHGRVLHTSGTTREIVPIELNLDEVRRSRERGILGLGQTLKSFRDNPVNFSVYQGDRRKECPVQSALDVPEQTGTKTF